MTTRMKKGLHGGTKPKRPKETTNGKEVKHALKATPRQMAPQYSNSEKKTMQAPIPWNRIQAHGPKGNKAKIGWGGVHG